MSALPRFGGFVPCGSDLIALEMLRHTQGDWVTQNEAGCMYFLKFGRSRMSACTLKRHFERLVSHGFAEIEKNRPDWADRHALRYRINEQGKELLSQHKELSQ